MRRYPTATRLLAIAVLSLGGLTAAACSRPTPASPAGEETGGAGSESMPPGPYYDDESAGAPVSEDDADYPGPRSQPEFFPEPYPEPSEGDDAGEDAAADDAAADPASGDETGGDEAGGDEAGDSSSDG